jgi:hypothetical protein
MATIGTKYLTMIQASVETCALPKGATEGLIALLHKGEGHNTLTTGR